MIVTIFDTESNGFLEFADTLWCIAATDRTGTEVHLWEPDQILAGLAHLHEADVLVGHNIIKHDLPLLKKLYGWEPKSHQVIIDTVVFSRKLNPKRPNPEGYTGNKPHSIEAWAHRVGMWKPEHEDWTQYSDEMGHRCIEDARINLKVLEELEREAAMLPDYYEQLKQCNESPLRD